MAENTLTGSSWHGSDASLSQEKVEEWKVYHQALRDLPANPVWPEPPK